MKRLRPSLLKLIIAAMCIIISIFFIMDLYARRNGITGRTSTTSQGCNCHNNNSSTSTSLTLLSNLQNYVVDPGSTTTFTVRVSNSNASAAGVNIGVKTTQTGETNAGTLSPATGSGLSLVNGELTHSSPKTMNGGIADFSFTWTAPDQPGVYYIRAIGIGANNNGREDSGDLWNWMSPQTITVRGLTVTSPNGGESFCTGTTQTISWTQYGVSSVKIELSTDGGNSFPITLASNVPGQNGSWSWNIPSDFQTGTNFKIKVSDASASNVYDVSDGTFAISSQPNITSHPQSAEVCEGQSITFSVTATGGSLSYQWRKNGVNINGANQNSYTINSVDSSHQGNYDVVISNQCGSPVTSNVATLTVKRKTVLLSQPQPVSVCLGSSVTFKIKAQGTNLSFQWQRNGNNIPGATDSIFQISNVSFNDSGFYSVIVSGACGAPVSSNRAKLTVLKPPSIKTHPFNKIACEGKSVEFSVNAEGDSLTYQWFQNGNPINNATNSTYIIQNVKKADEGDCTVLVKGKCEPSVYSNPATLQVLTKMEITKQPADISLLEGSIAKFTIFVSGDVQKYQWRKNGSIIPGQNSNELVINNVQMSDSGLYDCVITNDCDTIKSNSAKLTVLKKGKGPLLTLNQSTIDFGYVLVNKKKDFNELEIENKGDSTLIISEIHLTGTNQFDFQISHPNLPITLQPNQTLPLNVSFQSNSSGEKNAKIEFVSNSSTNPTVTLISRCIDLQVSEQVLDFGSVPLNETKELQFTLDNKGIIPVIIKNIEIIGKDSLNFSIEPINLPLQISTNQSKVIKVFFTPSSPDTFYNQLAIVYNQPNDAILIELLGKTSISDVNDDTFLNPLVIFPNPTQSKLRVKINIPVTDIKDIYITDQLGRIITKFSLSQFDKEILWWDLKDSIGNRCAAGFYLLILQSSTRLFTFPIYIVN
ncbi:choice-of-anchor D domain-containing protein [Bacteroidetes/Chlorobi group bacterium MS-B_bin-24]|nr:MAG: choice-of-anchor D domain-containing protein [Bacteroidetes/Chlorobi group bacterium MS-B_bin-24]